MSFSPITGGEGNIEFLFHLQSSAEGIEIAEVSESVVNETVKAAHELL